LCFGLTAGEANPPRSKNGLEATNHSLDLEKTLWTIKIGPSPVTGLSASAEGRQLHEIEHFGDFLVAFHSGHAGHPQTGGDIFDKRAIVLNKMADASEDHSAYSGDGRIFQRPGSSRTIFSNKKATLQLDNA